MKSSTSKSIPVFRSFAFAAVVGLLGSASAWAGPSNSITVSFRDLDLSTATGATTLYRRIEGAARTVCGYDGGTDLIERAYWRNCVRSAIDDAVTKVNSPLLTAVHTGRTPAMTAMLNK